MSNHLCVETERKPVGLQGHFLLLRTISPKTSVLVF